MTTATQDEAQIIAQKQISRSPSLTLQHWQSAVIFRIIENVNSLAFLIHLPNLPLFEARALAIP